MIKNEGAAKYISDLLLEIHGRLDESVAVVRERWPEEDEHYRSAVAKVLYAFYAELMNPLYRDHPALKPAAWDAE